MACKTSERTRQKIKMITVLTITTAMFLTELIVGYRTGSLALVNDSFNMISDLLSLLIGFICLLLATKETKKNTYGWARVEIWAALVNSIFMLALCFSIFTSSIERLISPEKVEEADLVLIVGGVGLAVNLIGVVVFLDETFREMKKNKKEQTEEQSVEACQQSPDSTTNDAFVTEAETGLPVQQTTTTLEVPAVKQRKISVTSIDRPDDWPQSETSDREPAPDNLSQEGSSPETRLKTLQIFQAMESPGVRRRSINAESVCRLDITTGDRCGHQIPGCHSPDIVVDENDDEDDEDEDGMNVMATVAHIYAGPPVDDDEDDADEIQMKNQKKGKKKKIKSGNQMNIQGIFLHLLGDALGSVSVIVCGLINKYCHGDWVDRMDPTISLVMVIIIVITTAPLVKQTSMILLQHVPKTVKIPLLVAELKKEVRDIANIHDLHVWQLVGTRIIASLHIRCSDLSQYIRASKQIKAFFHNNGIHSTTIQPEFLEHQGVPTNRDCYLECGPGLKCHEDTCCCVKKSSKKKKISTTSTSSGVSFQSTFSTDTAISMESDIIEVTDA